MKKATIMLMMLISLCGCSKTPNAINVQVKTEEIKLDARAIVTDGNHSYIPVDMAIRTNGLAAQEAKKVLVAIKEFEKIHPELEVVGWKLMYGKNCEYVYGLWIDHKSKF